MPDKFHSSYTRTLVRRDSQSHQPRSVPSTPVLSPETIEKILSFRVAGFNTHAIAPRMKLPHMLVDEVINAELYRLREVERRQSQRNPQLIRTVTEKAAA